MATENVKVVKIGTEEAKRSVTELRSKLRQLKDTMLSVEEGTKEYNDALQEAANIQHTLKEMMEEVNASAMDFGQIAGNVVKGVGGIVAGFQAAQATMNLFGIENETVIKSLQKMQSLMAITQAIPAIDDGFKAFGRLSDRILSVVNRLTEKTVAEEADTVATKANTTAMAANATATNVATTATNKFKKALISTGIGVAVVAIGALVANFDKLKAAITGTNDELEEQKKLQMEEHLKKVNAELGKRLSIEEQIRKAGGQDDVTIAEERVKSIEKEIKKKEELIKANRREQAQAYTAYNNAIQQGKSQKQINKLKEDWLNIGKKEDVYLKEIESIKTNQLKSAKEELEIEKKLQAARDIKAKQDEAAQAAEDARKTSEENRKKRIEDENKAVEELRKKYGGLAEDIKLYDATDYEKDLASLAKAEQKSIQTIEGALKKGIISKEQYEKDKLEIEKYYSQLRDNAQQEEAQRQREQSIASLDTTYQLEQAKLQKQYDEGLISEKDFVDRKKELLETYVQDYIDNIQFMLDTENGLTDEQILDLTNKINDVRAKLKPEETSTEDESLTKGISEAINASALALNDFSNNPAWGNILKNVATLTANWDTLHKQIKEGGAKSFSAYAQIAAVSLSAVAQLMNGLASEQDASTKEGFEQQKKFQVAGATMSMLSGIASAWASSMELGPIAGPIMGSILSSFMLATGIAQINKIKQTQFNSNGSTTSAGATPNTSAVNSVIAPVQYTQDVQGASIEGAIKDTRVYVTETDISNTQNKVSVTENEARY